MTTETVAQALLDAQVAWVIGRLTGDELPELAAKAVDDVLAIAQVPGMKTESVDVFYTRLFFVNSFPKP